jgi:hypothetical protein
MTAHATRAFIALAGDYYLCPLPQVQLADHECGGSPPRISPFDGSESLVRTHSTLSKLHLRLEQIESDLEVFDYRRIGLTLYTDVLSTTLDEADDCAARQ